MIFVDLSVAKMPLFVNRHVAKGCCEVLLPTSQQKERSKKHMMSLIPIVSAKLHVSMYPLKYQMV
jgi:hypothetical protein